MKKKIILILLALNLIVLCILGYLVIKKNDDNKRKEKVNEKLEITVNFKEEEYSLKDKEGNLSSKSKRNIPEITISNNQKIGDTIENNLKQILDENWTNKVVANAKEISENMIIPISKLGVEYIGALDNYDENKITFTFSMIGDLGIIDFNEYAGYTFSLKDGKLLTIDDISTDTDGLKNNLLKTVKDNILANNVDSIINPENLEEDIKTQIFKIGNYYLAKESLVIIIPKDTICNNTVGNIQMEIFDIDKYLKDEYKYKK